MRSEALKRAQARYAATGAIKAVTRNYCLKLHIAHDADIIAALEEQENKGGYIKKLIREDLEKRG